MRSRHLLGVFVVVVAVVVAAAALIHVGPLATGTSSITPRAVTVTADGRPGVCQTALVRAGTRQVDVAVAGARQAGGVVQIQDLQGIPQATSVSARTVPGGLRYRLDRPLARNLGGVVCVTAPAGTRLLGDPGRGGLRRSGVPAAGSLALTFRRGDAQSLAAAAVVAKRIGFVRGAFGGAWRAYAILALLTAGLAGSGWALRRALTGGSGRRVVTVVAAAGVANALTWSLLTPALQIPDEPAHMSYVQDLVEKGTAPRLADPALLSPELAAVIAVTGMEDVNRNPAGAPAWSEPEDRAIRAELTQPRSRVNQGSYPPVGDYPPLYYFVLAPAYAATTAAGGTSLDAITPLRALSALFAGVTVAVLLGFALELFGGRWAIAVPLALFAAYQPVLTWISGGVNPDALFVALTSTLFWLLARGLNRGCTPRLAAAVGLTLAAAILTKVTGLGLVPGVAAALVVLWRRGGDRLRWVGAGLLATALPLAVYAVVNMIVWDRPLLPGGVVQAASSVGSAAPGATHTSAFWTYLWQYASPAVGSMTDFFPGSWTIRDLWLPQWLGRFGWSDYGFPPFLSDLALVVFAAIAVCAVIQVVRRLRTERGLAAHLVVYAALAGGVLVAIARVGYGLRSGGVYLFEQGRYVVPLAALYLLALGFAADRLGRRAPTALAIGLGFAALHFAAALGITVARYYV